MKNLPKLGAGQEFRDSLDIDDAFISPQFNLPPPPAKKGTQPPTS